MPGPLSSYRGPTKADAVPRIPAKHHQQLIDDAREAALKNREVIAKRVSSRRARQFFGGIDEN